MQAKFREKQEWLVFLSVFLDNYGHRKLAKKRCWSTFAVFPSSCGSSERSELWRCIKSKEYCTDNILKLVPIHNDFELVIFELLLRRYNYLEGNILMGP